MENNRPTGMNPSSPEGDTGNLASQEFWEKNWAVKKRSGQYNPRNYSHQRYDAFFRRHLPRLDHGVPPFASGGEADRGEDDRGAAGAPPGDGLASPQGGVRTMGSSLTSGRREPVA